MKWFVDEKFFIGYKDKFQELEALQKDRKEAKLNHYKKNFLQIIKNLILADTLFIEKIFEESMGEDQTPDYKSILKNNGLSKFDYQIKNEDEPMQEDLTYPLKGIEEFIILLKATNIDKIKDYIVLYTLLDLGYEANSNSLVSFVSSLDCEKAMKEIQFYWRLENSYINSHLLNHITTDVQGLDFIPKEWTTSVLQNILELKHYDAMRIWLDWSSTNSNTNSLGALDPKMQKSFELMLYSLCECGKYNQAFLSLLDIENQVNPIRYKNIFRLFVNHIITHQKFEQLCSYHLSERQEELTKEYLRSSDSGLIQLYYLSFLASRKSTLDGLKYAKEFFEKLKMESENINAIGAEEALIMTRVVGLLMKLYSHTLPPLQKKFAFDYLNLEQGKFQIALNSKIAKENNIRIEDNQDDMDVDIERISEPISDQGKYTPFLNRKVDNIMRTTIPKAFEDPYKTSVRKPMMGNKSIIKNFNEQKKTDASPMSVLDAIRMKTPKPEPNFLTIQKRDHLLDDFEEDTIVYNEENEDITAGKASITKYLNNLKNKNTDYIKSSQVQRMDQEDDKSTEKFKRSSYAEMNILDSFRSRPPAARRDDFGKIPAKKPRNSDQPKGRITKESLLADLPDRVKNIKVESSPKEENKHYDQAQSSHSIEDVPMEIQEEVAEPKEEEMNPESSHHSSSRKESDHHEVAYQPLEDEEENSPEPDSLMIQKKEENEEEQRQSENQDEEMEPENESSSSSSSSKSDPIMGISVPKPRKMSFELHRPDLLKIPLNEDDGNEEIEILEDPNTLEPNTVINRPRMSDAKDDIEFEKRKRQKKKEKIMSYLYAGKLPKRKKTSDKKVPQYEDVPVGSDCTPEKDEKLHELAFPLNSSGNKEEEVKEDYNAIEHIKSGLEEEENIQSEQLLNLDNPFDSRISNKTLKDTIKSQDQNQIIQDRLTDSMNLLEKVKRQVERNMGEDEENLEIVQEVVSEKSSKSVASKAILSSNQSAAAPPISDNGSEGNIVLQAVSSKSGDEDIILTDRENVVEQNIIEEISEQDPKEEQPRRRSSRNKKSRYQGKKRRV